MQILRNRTRTALALLALLVLVAVAIGIFARRGSFVEAIQAQALPMVRTLQFSAKVAAPSRVDIGSTITGRVAQVLVKEGDEVKAGQLLLTLDASELDALVAQSSAVERQADARIATLRGTTQALARAQLEQAQANLNAAQSELERVRQLVAQGFLSASRLDDAKRTLEVSLALQQAAQAQVSSSNERGPELAQARASLEAAQAATLAARAKQAQAKVSAPSDARVLMRDVEPGQIVQPGRALLKLALSGPAQILATVDERYLDQLRTGQTAAVIADAFADQRMTAKVLRIAPGIDAQRGSVEVRFSLEQPAPDFLREEMSLSVEVETGRRERAIVLPLRALRTSAEGPQVWLAIDGVVQKRQVKLGLRTLDAVEIVEGVDENALVLLDPKVQPGDRVRAQIQAWKPQRSQLSQAGATDDPLRGLSQAMSR